MKYDWEKSIIPIGKYKFKSIEYVIENDPGYLVWAYDNKVKWFLDTIGEKYKNKYNIWHKIYLSNRGIQNNFYANTTDIDYDHDACFSNSETGLF